MAYTYNDLDKYELASLIRSECDWDYDAVCALCEIAGISTDEYEDCESAAEAAAKILDVAIYNFDATDDDLIHDHIGTISTEDGRMKIYYNGPDAPMTAEMPGLIEEQEECPFCRQQAKKDAKAAWGSIPDWEYVEA